MIIDKLLREYSTLPEMTVGIVCPESKYSVLSAVEIGKTKIANTILIGNRKRILSSIEDAHIKCDIEIIDSDTDESSIKKAIEMVHEGKINAIMKGNIRSDIFMKYIVKSESGLRTNRRMSHCMITQIPTYHKILFISDTALNMFPTLEEKIDIVQNTIDLTNMLGIEKPKVALLSASEHITQKIPSTIEYAIMCKMAERGEIHNCIMDGPISLDCAISKEASSIKKMNSCLDGDSDVLIVPNIEVGNVLIKSMDYFANAKTYGVILGTKVPVILTSRSAGEQSRTISVIIARKMYSIQYH